MGDRDAARPGRQGLPRRRRPAIRGVLGVALAAGMAALVAGCTPAGAAGQSHLTVRVTIHHSTFDPGSFSFARGTTVTFVIHNTDPIEHEFIVGNRKVQFSIEHTPHPVHDGSVPGQISVPPGTTRQTTFTFDHVTQYTNQLQFACHLPQHYRYGMHGNITVTSS